MADRRLEILQALLTSAEISTIITHPAKGKQVFLWLSPNQDIFPRVIVRELDNSSNRSGDNRTIWSRQVFEVAFTAPASAVSNFLALCEKIPGVMQSLGGRLISSGADTPIPEHGVVSKIQTFEFYSDEDE